MRRPCLWVAAGCGGLSGFDGVRRLHKRICEKDCPEGIAPRVAILGVPYPHPKFPYQDPEQQHGKVVNVAECFPDGSLRLVRDVPIDSPTWKRFYHQTCNAAEACNTFLESLDLKRLPPYGCSDARRPLLDQCLDPS